VTQSVQPGAATVCGKGSPHRWSIFLASSLIYTQLYTGVLWNILYANKIQ